MMRNQPPRISAVGQRLRNIVTEQPGIHFRGLGRAAKLTSAGQLRHHLDRLERQGVLVEIEDGRYKRFFVAGEHDPKLRPEIARFARVVPRRIAKLLLVNPMNRTELRRSLGCADSTLGYHLARMVLLGDLAKSRGVNCCNYSLTSEELVRKMLQMQAGTDIPSPPNPPDAPDDEPRPMPLPPLPPLPPLGQTLGSTDPPSFVPQTTITNPPTSVETPTDTTPTDTTPTDTTPTNTTPTNTTPTKTTTTSTTTAGTARNHTVAPDAATTDSAMTDTATTDTATTDTAMTDTTRTNGTTPNGPMTNVSTTEVTPTDGPQQDAQPSAATSTTSGQADATSTEATADDTPAPSSPRPSADSDAGEATGAATGL